MALLEAQGVSLSAESDQRTRAGAAQAFKKLGKTIPVVTRKVFREGFRGNRNVS